MLRLIILCVSFITLISCENNFDQKDFYDSGNLRSTTKLISDTVEFYYYFDQENSPVEVRRWSLDDKVIKVQYFTSEGRLYFESNLVNKEIEFGQDSNEFVLRIVNPKNEYLSLAIDRNVFHEDFAKFYYDLKRGNGIDLRVPKSERKDSLVSWVLFDEHYEILRDSTVNITADHLYIELKPN